jgi:hypothetical protein
MGRQREKRRGDGCDVHVDVLIGELSRSSPSARKDTRRVSPRRLLRGRWESERVEWWCGGAKERRGQGAGYV